MTWLLILLALGCYLASMMLLGRFLHRQRVLVELVELESDMAAYWSHRLCGFMQMRIDFGDAEALAWLDMDIEMTDGELVTLIRRGDELLGEI